MQFAIRLAVRNLWTHATAAGCCFHFLSVGKGSGSDAGYPIIRQLRYPSHRSTRVRYPCGRRGDICRCNCSEHFPSCETTAPKLALHLLRRNRVGWHWFELGKNSSAKRCRDCVFTHFDAASDVVDQTGVMTVFQRRFTVALEMCHTTRLPATLSVSGTVGVECEFEASMVATGCLVLGWSACDAPVHCASTRGLLR